MKTYKLINELDQTDIPSEVVVEINGKKYEILDCKWSGIENGSIYIIKINENDTMRED